ncbi:MAG: helix-turn-helix transcriptional regulator [Oscillospiraceae bacterium]|nr:helix-turn-helix transcriptional regulator [Oscillospiraceae bacterium]
MKELTDQDFCTLWGEALATADRDLYVSDWATSSIFGAQDEITDDDLVDQAAYLGQLWDVAHMSVQDIRTAAGLTQAAMATRFCVPKRTIEDWCSGTRTPPDYVRLMMAEALGLIRRLSKPTGGMNMEKRYVVVDRPISDGDWFQTVHRTAEEANEAAKTQWWYLTKTEKKRRHIAAYVVTESNLDPDDVEEYGLDSDYPWMSAPNMDGFPGAFDSAKLAEDCDDD